MGGREKAYSQRKKQKQSTETSSLFTITYYLPKSASQRIVKSEE